MITYEPFWAKLKAKKITTYALIKKYKISGNTINRLKHNKPIDTNTIEKLCDILNCDIKHILKYEKAAPSVENTQNVDNTDNQFNNNSSYQLVEHIENGDNQLNDTADAQFNDNTDMGKEYQQADTTEKSYNHLFDNTETTV